MCVILHFWVHVAVKCTVYQVEHNDVVTYIFPENVSRTMLTALRCYLLLILTSLVNNLAGQLETAHQRDGLTYLDSQPDSVTAQQSREDIQGWKVDVVN